MTDQPSDPSSQTFYPTPDPSRSESVKSAAARREQAELARKRVQERDGEKTPHENPIVNDETYGSLREDNRVVMRHTIALNIDSFRPSSEEFEPRVATPWPELADATPPFFSVIVPNFNGEQHLATLLTALRRQTLHDFEVVVVDDASTDDSIARIERDFPDTRVIANRENLGFAASCNVGAAAATGRILVLLNSDTEPDPHWLAELAKGIVAHPEAASFASKLLLFDRRDTLHTAGDMMQATGMASNRGAWEVDRGQYDAMTQVFSACGGAAAYRRDVWEALGGFDENFWMYLEDVDLGFRARLAGWEAVFVPAARVYHKIGATAGGEKASYYVGRNSIWLIAKDMPAHVFWKHLPSIARGQLQVALDALRTFRGPASRARLRGQLAGLRGLPFVLHQRRVVQQRRVVRDSEIDRLLQG